MADAAIAATTTATPVPPAGGSSWHLWKDGSAGFRDLLDAINPLQHLPVVGAFYRWATGDEPGKVARVAGDALYGGPLGFVGGLFAALTSDSEGHDLGEQAITAVLGPADRKGTMTAAVRHPSDDPAWLATFPGAATPDVPPLPAATVAALYRDDPAAAGMFPRRDAAPATMVAAATPPATAATPDLPREPSKPAAAPGAAAPAAAPERPSMPLQRVAAASAAAGPEQAFLARNAALQRQAASSAPLSNRVVPLELTGGLLPARPGAAVATRAAPVPPGPTAVAAGDGPRDGAATLPGNAPVDVSQKMLDALDKYMRMQQAHSGSSERPRTDIVQ